MLIEKLSYDAWGKRRHPTGADDPAGGIESETTRGFTGHEQLDEVGLVHMNGRVYDPLIGRFGTVDPRTEAPYSSQGWNRYAYVGNSPVNFPDPSGYCFLGCFWNKAFKAIGKLLRKIPILGTILRLAAAAICTAMPGCQPLLVTVLSSTAVSGLTSGSLGQALKFISPAHRLVNIAGHAGVGCLTSAASGGKCGSGAAAGAVGAAATPFINTGSVLGDTAGHAVVGGLAGVPAAASSKTERRRLVSDISLITVLA